MLYTIPDYYHEFSCIAGKCEDTCCAGWQIVADEAALKKYKKVTGSFRKRLRRSINWKEGTFKQDKNKRCAFLNDENLCDMYTALGEKSLCRTCKMYPRHVEEFEDVREMTLSVSCPEVARILLGKKEPVRFLTYESNKEEEYDDLDDEIVVISQEPEIPSPEPVFAPISNSDELVERAGREINVNNFGKTDEERYAMLEQLQQTRRGRTKKEVVLFKDDEEANEQPNNSITEHFDFDIRQAIISSEILNRKY